MIPRLKPTLGVAEWFAAWSPPRRDEVVRFESGFARLMGQRHALAFPYGRSGLMLLLEALGLKGREVICPAYTCVVVPHAIVLSGNEPVFADCAEGGFNMDLDQAEALVNDRTGALIATSLFGYPVNLDRLDALRHRYPHVTIVQDCAHSFAAEWDGRMVQQAGVAAVFGLNISKLITAIFGGMITTDDDALAERLRGIRDRRLQPADSLKAWRRRLYLTAVYPAFNPSIYALINLLERLGFLNRLVRYYDDTLIDMPADHLMAMTAVEARVGNHQLDRYQTIIRHRRDIAALYDRLLAKLPGLHLPPRVEGATYSHYVPRVTRREPVLEGCRRHGLQLGQLIEYCIPEMPCYADRPGSAGTYPRASTLARTTLNLPLHINPDGARRVASVVEHSLKSYQRT